MDQRFYVPAVFHLISIIRSILIAHGSSNDCSRCDQGIGVVEKLLLFDLSFIFDTYIYSLMEKVNQTSSKLKSYAENLEAKVMERTRRLEEQARYDGLTKLLNQQAFYAELKRELLRSQRKSHATVLIYFDLDGFKKLNDSQGHQRGDEILSLVGDCMRSTVRKHEILARYGGDEFCIVLAESTLADAKTTCRRLFEAIKTATKGSGIACSAGLALSLPEKGLDADTLVKRADTAMYKAKKTPGFTMEIAQG